MSYNTGLWGNERAGIGAFYFGTIESNYYVDLSEATSGHAGTIADPFNVEDFRSSFNKMNSSATYNIKGSCVTNELFKNTFASGVTFQDWDNALYGPWRLTISGTSDITYFGLNDGSQMYFRNGMIYYIEETSKKIFYGKADYHDMLLRTKTNSLSTSFIMNMASSNLYGCTLDVSGTPQINVTMGNGFVISAFDTVFYKLMEQDGDPDGIITPITSAYYENCVFKAAEYQVENPTAVDVKLKNNCQYEASLPDLPEYDGLQSEYNYNLYSPYITIDGTNNWDEYNTGLWGNERLGVGAFLFLPLTGHIGAFYFGPVGETIEVENIFDVSAVLLDPIVSATQAASATFTPFIWNVKCELLQPANVYSFQDFTFDFVGVPVVGSSPLAVEFTALVNFRGSIKGKYRVKEYRWCFDYDYDNEVCNIDWVTTTQNPYTHTYTGYRGQQYSVKCCVTLELI